MGSSSRASSANGGGSARFAEVLATLVALAQIDHFGLGSQVFQQLECPPALGELGYLAVGVGQIAEHHRPGRAGFNTGRRVFARAHRPPLGAGAVAGVLESMVTQGAL